MSEQPALFDVGNKWDDYWVGMPEFNQEDLMPFRSIKVHFRNKDDVKSFFDLIDQNVTPLTKSVWFPKAERNCLRNKRYSTNEPVNPKYPLYIISKGRWESRLTVKALEEMNVHYRIVIEPQEFDKYSSVIDPQKILVLPFSNLGQGSIPARNWVWEHSISEGHERHWILDDNIINFIRQNNNVKIRIDSGVAFKIIEDFVDRYYNIDMAGMNYRFLGGELISPNNPPIIFNTRVYSCILLNNNQPYRWRGKYNEDTDLSIRILKSGRCTALFNVFKCDKKATMTMTGGNTDELYKDDGRFKMAQSLQDQHPDIVTITRKWNRPQHQVDYSVFKKNKPILKENVNYKNATDEFGMFLRNIDETINNCLP